MKRKALYYIIFTVAAAGAAVGSWIVSLQSPSPSAPASASKPAFDTSAIAADMKTMLASYRKIIVLTQDEAALSSNEKAQANRVGQ